MSQELREQIDKFKNWGIIKEYKELEFVCHNSDSKTSTDRESQLNLYNDLKELEKESDYSIKPYMQDFSEGNNIQLSLSVIILDKDNEKKWEKIIRRLAKKHGVKFDLYIDRTEQQVNSIIRGDYYNNMI
jgi:hypothetical protein